MIIAERSLINTGKQLNNRAHGTIVIYATF